jgi:hypothetical protein
MAISTLTKALDLLRRSGARLVLQHTHDREAGFYIWPKGGRVAADIAQKLLERNDIQPLDSGLLPGHPQSWALGDWRKR